MTGIIKPRRRVAPDVRAWLLTVVLLVAGCATPDEGGSVTPTGTPSPGPSPEPTPSTTPTPTPSPTPPEPTVPSGSPIPPEPRVVYERTFDFATEGDATGQSPRTFTSDRVGEEFSLVTINVTLVRSATPATLPISGTISTPTVRVLDPDGEEVFLEAEEGAAREETLPSKVGTYSVRFEGAGTLRATVRITASS